MASPNVGVKLPEEAKADVRRIDRTTAKQILNCLARILRPASVMRKNRSRQKSIILTFFRLSSAASHTNLTE